MAAASGGIMTMTEAELIDIAAKEGDTIAIKGKTVALEKETVEDFRNAMANETMSKAEKDAAIAKFRTAAAT